MLNNSLHDKELLIKVADGDTRAFTELVGNYWQGVYLHVLTYLKRSERSEEVTQDIFMDVWKQRKELPLLNSFPNFLFKITRFTTIDALRKKLEILDSYKDLETALKEEFYLPDLQLDLKQANEYLLGMIEQMPDRRRAIFKLSRIEGKSQAEIALALNISKHTVNAQIMSAMEFLRVQMAAHPQGALIGILLITGLIK